MHGAGLSKTRTCGNAAAVSQPSSVFNRSLCAVLLCLAAHAEDRRERKDVAIPPPQPVPQEISVERGEDVIIPLRIYGQRNQVLTFLIRKPPRGGQVSGLKNTGANSAIVHYRATVDRTVRQDVFEYAVKSTEGVSAAVPVRIEIIDKPPDLAGPAEVLFPPQLNGSAKVQTIELLNRGGTTAEGECLVAPPWRIEGGAKYRVEPGGRFFAKVAFVPDKAGDFLGELRLTSQPDRAVILRGIAHDALAVNPPALRLVLDPSTLVRAGVIEVTNNTDSAQIVRLSAGARLRTEPELRIEPGRTAPLMVRTQPDDATALDAELLLDSGAHRARVAVSAVPLPPIFRAVERTIDLGLVPGGTIGAGQLTLRNAGGAAGWAALAATPPFRIDPQRVELAPGATATVAVTVDGSAVGTIEQTVEVRSASGSFTVPLRAVIVAPGSAPPRLSRSAGELPSAASATPRATPMPASVHDLDLGRADPRQAVHQIMREPTRCIFEWDADLNPPGKLTAQRCELSIQGGNLTEQWLPMPNFSTAQTGRLVRGTFDKLSPSRRYTVRVLAVTESTRTQVFQTSFDTPPAASRLGKTSLLLVLCAAAIALVIFVSWQRRRPPVKRTSVLKKTQRIA